MSETITCPRCSTPNQREARYCVNCGESLPGAVSPAAQSPSGPATQKTGTILNERYRIALLLGKGGFGAVYKAWDINLTRHCAIKENLDTSPEAQRQFLREAQVLANLSHPNLPRVTDHFILPSQGQYLVMDFIDGEDLESLVRRQGAVPPAQAIPWIAQVADALGYLHTRQPPILHRDIKPANIRLTPEGRVFLVDFGLVKEYDPLKATTLGARAVTPGYSPPEQYGAGTTDERSDIYALGATLYALLTGTQPPDSVSRITQDNLISAQQVNPQVSPSVGYVINHAMSLQPDSRYRSISDFKAELTGQASPYSPDPTVQTPPPIQSTIQVPPPPAEPPSKTSSLSRFWPAAALLLLVIICMISVALLWPEYGPDLSGIYSPAETPTTQIPTAEPSQFMITPTAIDPATQTLEAPIPNPTSTPTTEISPTPTPSPLPTSTSTPTYSPTPHINYDLAFASDRSGVMEVYLMDTLNPGEWLALSNPSGYTRAWWPSFCGSQVAVEVQDLSGSLPTWIFLLNPLSNAASRWHHPGEPNRLAVPRCSPDNQYMAYSAHFGSDWDLVVAENATNDITPVYSSAISGFGSWPRKGETLYSMAKPESGFEIRLTENLSDPGAIITSTLIHGTKFPAISPDGTQLAYICNGTSAICVLDLESGSSRQLHSLDYVRINDTAMPASVMWSGDGQWLYFASADGGDWDIFRIRPDGSDLQNLTPDWTSNELMPAMRW
jgi:serine/threonine protein kinase